MSRKLHTYLPISKRYELPRERKSAFSRLSRGEIVTRKSSSARVIDAHAMHRVSFYNNFATFYPIVVSDKSALRALIEDANDI